MTMYFDAILDKDMKVVFNASPEEVREYCVRFETAPTDQVCDGQTLKMMTVPEYLAKK